VDGSDSARQAARWAGAIAERFRVPLHVVHAMPRFGGPDPSDVAAFYRAALLSYHADNAEAFLESASKAVRAEHSDLEVSTSATAHPVDDLLEELSARAVMIVLGGVDVTPAAAFLLGSTTLTLAARSRCPVVAWRGHHTDVTADSIVVGVDDSPGGRACLGVALDFADRLGVAVRVVHSWSKVRPDDGLGIPMLIDWVALERNQRAAIEQWVDDAAASHPDVGVECFLESTSPSRALLAHVGGAQLVMVGNRARHPLAVAALGSTSLNMLHHSAIPVAVCHVARNAE
jgi:nucleotide-binding universal stress UspA family protein